MRRTLHDVAILAARIGVGGIFFANGWTKLEAGLNATTDQFTRLDAPLPYAWAAVTMLVELLGGAMLVAGFLVPICGILLLAEALAVFVVASGDPGQPLTGGDASLVVALGAASILLSVAGAGRASVDHMVVIKRRETGGDPGPGPDAEADAMLSALRGPRTEPETAAAAPAIEPAPSGTGKDAAASGADPAAKPAAESTGSAAEPAAGASDGAGSAATAPARTRKPRQRRTDTGSAGTTASRSEAPAEKATAAKGAAEKAEKGAGDKGDKLVAGGPEGASG